MKLLQVIGEESVARVYIGQTDQGQLLEWVESVQPPIPLMEKWVNIISTLYGCPVGCRFCDAGGGYGGKVALDEMLFQIDTMVKPRFDNGRIPVRKWKIQFARMGEPAMNDDVLDLLETLPQRYDAPGLLPCISTIAPSGKERFFERLLEIKQRLYQRRFQLQFSIHSTRLDQREWLIPIPIWSFDKIARYAEWFCSIDAGDRKATLNFALAQGMEVDPKVLLQHFSPDLFLIKITPVNPTYRSKDHHLTTFFTDETDHPVLDPLREAGYEVILSIGELEENQIGSNCGQYIQTHQRASMKMQEGYRSVSTS